MLKSSKLSLLTALKLLCLVVHCQSYLTIEITDSATVDYNGTLTCDSGNRFCALIYYMEYDLVFPNDDLEAFVPLQCSENNVINHKITVNFTGGEMPGDLSYEPYIEVYHNCGGTIGRHSYYHLPQVEMQKRKIAYNYTYAIKSLEENTGDSFFMDEALRAKELQNPEEREKTFQWLVGKRDALLDVADTKKAVNETSVSLLTDKSIDSMNTTDFENDDASLKTKAMFKNVSVQYNGQLTCTTGKPFCAMVHYLEGKYFEHDGFPRLNFGFDDRGYVSIHCTEKESLHHEILINMTGGENENDYKFDPVIEVFHNCGKKVLRAGIRLDQVSLSESTVSVSYNITITDRGEKIGATFLLGALRADIYQNDPELMEETKEWLLGRKLFVNKVQQLISNGTSITD